LELTWATQFCLNRNEIELVSRNKRFSRTARKSYSEQIFDFHFSLEVLLFSSNTIASGEFAEYTGNILL